ncbi:hypothetical protein BHK98_09285 [Hornefia porci]|uniref:Uncharacterized protein n=1 Tax=Hornefia porci TaxID=2652292 RepID=A0A1Q9JJ58_9FIRM|nr:hypothetical protein BHK98_09285 [Hornefia porci]
MDSIAYCKGKEKIEITAEALGFSDETLENLAACYRMFSASAISARMLFLIGETAGRRYDCTFRWPAKSD